MSAVQRWATGWLRGDTALLPSSHPAPTQQTVLAWLVSHSTGCANHTPHSLIKSLLHARHYAKCWGYTNEQVIAPAHKGLMGVEGREE